MQVTKMESPETVVVEVELVVFAQERLHSMIPMPRQLLLELVVQEAM